MIGESYAPEQFTCSRAGCGASAQWRIEWRNPKIHTEERKKVWLACEAHRDFLREFLAARSFPVAVVPVDGAELPAEPGSEGSA